MTASYVAEQELGISTLSLSKDIFEDDKAIINWVDALHSESKHLKWPYERQWYYNINFYLGRQYVIPNDSSHRFHDRKKTDPAWRVRHVANKIKPFIIRKIAKLVRIAPDLEVAPGNGDFSSIQKAKLCNKVIEFKWEELGMEDLLTNEALLWACITGNAFVRVAWNSSLGPRMSIKRDSIGGDDELFKDLYRRARKKEPSEEELASASDIEQGAGDIDVSVVSPFSFFCHPNAKKLEDSMWILESSIKDIDTVKEQWGDDADEIKEESEADMAWAEYEERLLENSISANSTQRAPRAKFPKVIEKQFWLRPCRMFPEGKYVVVAGGVVLHNDLFPYEHGQLPFIHFKDVHIPGRFWGQSIIEDVIPIQKAINALTSKRQENLNLHANAKWMVPKGSGIQRTSLTSGPGEVITYNEGKKPEQVVPPPFPAATQELTNQHNSDLDEITGQQEASRGIAPGRVDSGTGIISLQEADDNRLDPISRHLKRCYGRIGSQILHLAKQFYKEQRLIRITGRRGLVEVRQFTGSDLASEGFNGRFDVRTRVGTGLPLGRAARVEMLTNLAKVGAFNFVDNARDKEVLFKTLEVGGPIEDMFESSESARSQAHIENSDFAAGYMHAPNVWDDHIAHIEVHTDYMRRPEFIREATDDPTLIQRYFMHIQMHKQATVIDQLQNQQLLAPLQQGQPQPPQPQVPAPEQMGAPA